MTQMMKWSFALLLAFASIAQAQDNQPKSQDKVTGAVYGWTFPSWSAGNSGVQEVQSLNGVLVNQYLNDVSRQQPSYYVFQGGGDQGSGLILAPVDEAARAHLKLPKGQGLIATSVATEGPAARAGVCQNDILLSLGDASLAKPEDLEEHLKAAGDKALGLVLLHQGAKKTLQVQPQLNVTFGPVRPAPPEFWIGVSVSTIEPALRAHLKIPANQGLISTEVIADSPAAKAELKVNDILLTMAGQPLRDQAGLVDLVQKNGEKTVAIDIVREGSHQTFQVTPQRRKKLNPTPTQGNPSSANINVWRTGALLQGQEWPVYFYSNPNPNDTVYLGTQFVDINKAAPQPQANPVSDRLDGMAAEIKELRKVIEELGKVLKDRK
jgi:membrane-associated protease RseP (regulator of RpoE activity)